MFDIAWSELLLIAVVALIFIGPKELPALMHTVGKALAKLRRTADDFRRQFEESMRESGYEELQKNIHDFRALNPANQLRASIDRAISQEYAPKPPQAVAPGTNTSSAAANGSASDRELQGRASGTGSVERTSGPDTASAPDVATAKQPAALPENSGDRVDKVA